MDKPTQQDAVLLIQHAQLGVSRGMPEAMNWLFSDAFIPDYQEFVKKYAPGSREFGLMRTIAVQYEGLGTLLKHGLVNEDLLFDWFLPPWERMKGFMLGERQRHKDPLLGENFEFLAQRHAEWRKTHVPVAPARHSHA